MPVRLSFAVPWLVALLAASTYSYAPTLFIPFLHIDEGAWALYARAFDLGLLYTEITDLKPPLLIQTHWLFSLGGHSLLGLRVGVILWSTVGAYAFYRTLQRFTDEETALIASALLALSSGTLVHGAYSGERAYLPWLCLSAWAATSVRAPMGAALLAGLGIGAATVTKHQALFLALVPALMAIRRAPISGGPLLLAGAALSTLASWLACGVPFSVILREAYLLNFRYVGFNPLSSSENVISALRDIAAVSLLHVPLLTIGTFMALKEWGGRVREFSRTHPQQILDIVLWGAASLATVSLGRRFLLQYFVVIIPILAWMAVRGARSRKARSALVTGVILTVGAHHIVTAHRELSDRNKNWDSEIERVVASIRADTAPEDRIWVSNSIFGVYFAADRLPAVRNIYFQNSIGYLDPCRVESESFRDRMDFEEYREMLEELTRHKPKVIFWTLRESNNCSSRMTLDRFERLQAWISSQYRIHWTSPLGVYWMRRPEIEIEPKDQF